MNKSVFRDAQFISGFKSVPGKTSVSVEEYEIMADEDCKMLCLNDTIRDIDFEQCKATILAEFEKNYLNKLIPQKLFIQGKINEKEKNPAHISYRIMCRRCFKSSYDTGRGTA